MPDETNGIDGAVLNLGSGRAYDPAAVNLDITPDTKPDIVHDLNVLPWPFVDNQFAEILAIDVLEHLERPLDALEEIHRIGRPGALVRIALPHFSSANCYTDPTHRTAFGFFSFDYVTGAHEHSYYTSIRFRYVKREIVFDARPTNRFVRPLANRWPWRYECRWAWIFPAWFVKVDLEVLKTS